MKIKRLTAVMLGLLLLVSFFSPVVSAATRTQSGMIDKYEQGAADPLTFNVQYADAIEALYLGMMNLESDINLYGYSVPTSSAGALYAATVHTHPELFFYQLSYRYSYSGSVIYALKPQYTNTQAEVAVMLEEFYAKADKYLSLVNDDMSDFAKCLILHDALALNSEYDITREIDGQTVQSTNYTLMVEGWGKCENYSECLAYLLAQLGIKSEIVTSDSMVHEWMKVKLDGSDYYYNIDLTWDDPLYSGIGDRPGKAEHTYFLLSDDEIQAIDHEGYYFIHGDNGVDYGHANLHAVDNPFCWTAGNLYTLYKSGNAGYVATYDPSTDSFTNKVTINDKWYAAGGGYWVGNFSYIAGFEGLLYFNGENCVYVYDPYTNTKTTYISNALTDGNKLYGLLIRDGMIYGLSAPDPNTAPTQVLLGGCKCTASFVTDMYAYENYSNQTAPYGSLITAPAEPTKSGYVFGGWYVMDEDAGWAADSDGMYYAADGTGLIGLFYDWEGNNGDDYMRAWDFANDTISGDTMLIAKWTVVPADEISSFTGHSLSVNGDIGMNYYIDVPDDLVSAGKVTVTFIMTSGGVQKSSEITLGANDKTANGYLALFKVSAAEMSCDVTAVVTVDGVVQEETFTYSVKQYANVILTDNDFISAYIASENEAGRNGEERYQQLTTLVKTMLDYGSKAQLRFDRYTDDLANGGTDYYTGEETITKTADDMSAGLASCGLRYVGSSVIYLSEMTLRHYYVIEDASLFTAEIQNNITFGGESVTYGEYNGMIYFDKTEIAASQLDTLYAISINGREYKYCVLDYSALALESASTSQAAKDLASALYRYNAAANAYYGD